MTLKQKIASLRPQTLSASTLPILAAVSVGHHKGFTTDVTLLVFIMLSAICIQLGTNLFNDAYDLKKGSDTDERKGSKRLGQFGVPFKKIRNVALVFYVLAVLFSIPIILKTGWVVIAIGVASLFFGYLYTATRYSLAYLGLADIFVVLFFGFIAVCGTAWVLFEAWHYDFLIMGFLVGLMVNQLLVLNNLRDYEEDKKTGKKTLVVRFGEKWGRAQFALQATIVVWGSIYFLSLNYVSALMGGYIALSMIQSMELNKLKSKANFNKMLKEQGVSLLIVPLVLLFLGTVWK